MRDADAFDRELRTAFGDSRVHRNEPLARLTTFRVGGRADWLLELRSGDEVGRAAAFASREGIPITVLGGGSNVLVSDRGVRGIVVRMHGGEVASIDSARVRAEGGVTINGLVRWTVVRGVAGLEAWAGTPGTVGGAIHGNAHFRGRLIGDLVESVTLTDPGGIIELDFAIWDSGDGVLDSTVLLDNLGFVVNETPTETAPVPEPK